MKHVEEVYLPSRSNSLDWKHYKRGWQYSSDAPHNKKWKKDRDEFFKLNGNRWWYYSGYIIRRDMLTANDHHNMNNTKKKL